jgi:RNA polymerase sigma factor (sigma-70 family)
MNLTAHCDVSITPAPRSHDLPRRCRASVSTQRDARFNAVVLPHFAAALALARRLTGNRVDCEDVVQDACIRALRGIDNFAHGNARAWVLTIVRHAAYDWLSRNRPAMIVQVESVEATSDLLGEPLSETPETQLVAHGEKALLHNAIASLPARFRECLLLRYNQGLSYREIAASTGVPIGTVMSRLARARQQVTMMIGVRNPA